MKNNTKFNHFAIFSITLDVVYIVSQVSLICFAMHTAITNVQLRSERVGGIANNYKILTK